MGILPAESPETPCLGDFATDGMGTWDHMGTIKVIKDLLLSWMIHKFNRVNQICTRETMLHYKYDEAKIDCKHLLLLLLISGRGAS